MARKQLSIDELRERFHRARIKLQEAEENERDRIRRPALRKQVGKCFVFSNSYGDGQRWPLYARIVGFDEKAMTYEAVEFQRTTRNEVEVKFEQVYNWEHGSIFGVESGWQPISVKEYNKQKRAVIRLIHGLLEKS